MDNNQNRCPWCKGDKNNCGCNRWGRKIIGILLILFAIGLIISYGAKTFASRMNPRTVVITGKGEVSAVPNVSTINFTLRATGQDENTKALQENITNKMNSILKKLTDLGIEEKDIQTAYYNVNPRYDYSNGNSRVVGYEASQSVNVKVRDTNNVSKVLDILAGEKVTEVSGPNFEIDNPDNLKNEARDLAVQDAKEKARSLAKTLGVRINKIISYSDDSTAYNPTPIYAQAKNMGMGGSPAIDANLPAGENKIISNVYISFQIED